MPSGEGPHIETNSDENTEKKDKYVGSYKIGPTLGKGSFCKVKLATHEVSGQKVMPMHFFIVVLLF